MPTMFAWKAVGLWFSLRVTCMTGQTSRQNLCPDVKHPYALFRHFSTNSSWSLPSPSGSAFTFGSFADIRLPLVRGLLRHESPEFHWYAHKKVVASVRFLRRHLSFPFPAARFDTHP